MAFSREYYPSDTIKILNESEGKAGISGKLAHAFSRHLVSTAKGSLHQGVDRDTFANRFANDPLDEHGEERVNSGWAAKGDMAVVLCELLNSDVGQYGLSGLDGGATRACVQYFGTGSVVDPIFRQPLSGNRSEFRFAAVAPTITYHNNHPKNPLRGQVRSITPNKRITKGVIRMKDLVGSFAVLDKMGDRLHLQTFFPLFTISGLAFGEYQIGGMKNVGERKDGGLSVTHHVL